MASIAPIVIPAAVKQTASIIFLHGLGDTGHGWASEIAGIKPKHAKLICPTADERPVTINANFEMPAWFDIRSLDKEEIKNEDAEGVKNSAALITQLIEEEVQKGINPGRILLGGFSQGAAMSLYIGLAGKFSLGGIIALSGYIPIRDTIEWDKIYKPPILQCHGDMDEVIPMKVGERCNQHFTKIAYPDYTFKSYRGMGHFSCEQEMMDVNQFFKKCLPSPEEGGASSNL